MTWADENYTHKKLITIDHNKVAADATDFAVLVSITDSDLTGCLANGYDIKFYDSTEGTQLKHEREDWDNSNGTLVAWVKIPSLSSSVDTLFYMYYEYPDEDTDQADPTNVWDAAYLAVYHANDLTTSTLEDSTSNSYDLTKHGANEPIEANGKIGKCQTYDGNNDYVKASTTSILGITGDYVTLETWLKVTDHPETNYQISGKEANYKMDIDSSGHIRFLTSGNWGGSILTTTGTLTEGEWYYLVAVFNQTIKYVYINGVVDPTTVEEEADLELSSQYFSLGAYHQLPDNFLNFLDGSIDDVRVSNVARPATWITTVYNTMNDPAGFMSWGNEEFDEVVPTENVQIWR